MVLLPLVTHRQTPWMGISLVNRAGCPKKRPPHITAVYYTPYSLLHITYLRFIYGHCKCYYAFFSLFFLNHLQSKPTLSVRCKERSEVISERGKRNAEQSFRHLKSFYKNALICSQGRLTSSSASVFLRKILQPVADHQRNLLLFLLCIPSVFIQSLKSASFREYC